MNPRHLLPLVGGNLGRAITLEQLIYHSRRNGGGEFHVELTFLADFTETSIKSVSRYVQWLEDHGFIRIRRERHTRGYGVVLYFRVLVRFKEAALASLKDRWERTKRRVSPVVFRRGVNYAVRCLSPGVNYNSFNSENSKNINAVASPQICSAAPRYAALRAGEGADISGRGFSGREKGFRVDDTENRRKLTGNALTRLLMRRRDLPSKPAPEPTAHKFTGLKKGPPADADKAVAQKQAEVLEKAKASAPKPLAAAQAWNDVLRAYGDDPFPLEDKKHLAHVRTTLALVQANTLGEFIDVVRGLVSQFGQLRSTLKGYKKTPAHPWAINRHLKAGHISVTANSPTSAIVQPPLTNHGMIDETPTTAEPTLPPLPKKEKLTFLQLMAKSKKEKGVD